jgi:hypothetical protein
MVGAVCHIPWRGGCTCTVHRLARSRVDSPHVVGNCARKSTSTVPHLEILYPTRFVCFVSAASTIPYNIYTSIKNVVSDPSTNNKYNIIIVVCVSLYRCMCVCLCSLRAWIGVHICGARVFCAYTCVCLNVPAHTSPGMCIGRECPTK